MRFGAVTAAGLMIAAGVAQGQQSAQQQQSTQAQQSAQAQPNTQTQQWLQKQLQDALAALDHGRCPGTLSARQQSPVGTMWTVSQEDAKDPAFKRRGANSGVYVALKSTKGALREIELNVSYIAPGARIMPVDSTDEKDMRQKTFELSAGGQRDVDGYLLVGPAFRISSVHLISATYADGTMWHARSEEDCRVEPSRFLQVATR